MRQRGMSIGLLLGWAALFAAQPHALADADLTAVNSKVASKDYIRRKLPDGSYQPEEYFLKNGGRYEKTSGDASIDHIGFPDIAPVIVERLGTEDYIPAKSPKTGKLIILVTWGVTIPPDLRSNRLDQMAGGLDLSEADFENYARLNTDGKNAGILGYDFAKIHSAPSKFEHLYPEAQKELSELEGERYFVVLMAYDCRTFLRQKKYKELWETRFSTSTHNTNFTKALAMMAQAASTYFGKDSQGLQHVPEGRVSIGEPKSLGNVPEK